MIALKRTILSSALLFLPMLAACSQDMALQPGMKSIDTQKQSIAIFTLLIKNDFKPGFGLAPMFLWVDSPEDGTTKFAVGEDWEGDRVVNSWTWSGTNEFPISFALKPGKYTIGEVRGLGANYGLQWEFDFPLNTQFDLPPGSVVYLGHAVMSTRERKGDEQRSGDITPLVPQGLSGLNSSTMDISITDQNGEDIPKFLTKYPCLKNLTIQKAIMTTK